MKKKNYSCEDVRVKSVTDRKWKMPRNVLYQRQNKIYSSQIRKVENVMFK